MKLDIGLVVVVAAALVFYLRLIIIQRQRIKRLAQPAPTSGKKKKGASSKDESFTKKYAILSSNRWDWIIAGIGALAVLAGLLLYGHIIPLPAVQSYWWIPTAAGIVAFSWGFK